MFKFARAHLTQPAHFKMCVADSIDAATAAGRLPLRARHLSNAIRALKRADVRMMFCLSSIEVGDRVVICTVASGGAVRGARRCAR